MIIARKVFKKIARLRTVKWIYSKFCGQIKFNIIQKKKNSSLISTKYKNEGLNLQKFCNLDYKSSH